MVIFDWDDSLITGISLVDQQHRQIFRQINAFFISFKCGQAQATVGKCLQFLQEFILYHFQTEEAFQVKSAYPDYRSHQARHKALATQVKFFSVRLGQANYDPALMDEFRAFLELWMREHILGEDLIFAAHYRAYLAAQPTPPPETSPETPV